MEMHAAHWLARSPLKSEVYQSNGILLSYAAPDLATAFSETNLEKILQETECWYWNTSIPRQLKAVLRMGEKAKTARLSYHKALKLQKPLHLISLTKENKTVTRASANVLIPRKVLVKSNSTMPQSCKQGQPAPPALLPTQRAISRALSSRLRAWGHPLGWQLLVKQEPWGSTAPPGTAHWFFAVSSSSKQPQTTINTTLFCFFKWEGGVRFRWAHYCTVKRRI